MASQAQLQVRGAAIELPLELKIRIKDFGPEKKLRLSGLRSDSKDKADLECQFYQPQQLPLIGLYELGEKKAWVCRDTQTEVLYPIDRSLKIASRFPFTWINGKKFRGQLSLQKNADSLMLINNVKMEDYLTGLVNKEISSRYPGEAIKAQVIAARSYALATLADRRKRPRLYDLKGSEADQVYQGASYEDSRSRRFVRETTGQVLTHKSDILKAYYHAASGGHSEIPQNVWMNRSNPTERGAYKARPSHYDKQYAPTNWSITLSSAIGERWPDVGRLKDIFVVKRSRGQRVQGVLLVGEKGTKTVRGAEFRRLLGNRWLKSTMFWVKKNEGSWTIEGRGFGHGVGMSQLGAKAMARKGKSAEEILAFYYPNASINELQSMLGAQSLSAR